MANLANLARMTTATTGTGTITLLNAATGFLTFAQAGIEDGMTVSYAIEDGDQREAGRGVYTASGTTLTRTVSNSTNSDAAINLSGNAQVFITALAEDFGDRQPISSLLSSIASLLLAGNKGKAVMVNATEDGFELGSAGMKKHAEGYIDVSSLTTGTGEDNRYTDITIPALPDATKAHVEFAGSGAVNLSDIGTYTPGAANRRTDVITCRVINATTIRISAKQTSTGIAGRYIVWDLS